jgi:uncharacterized protein YeeX (DUF496 family)
MIDIKTDLFDLYIRAKLREESEFLSGSIRQFSLTSHRGVVAVVGAPDIKGSIDLMVQQFLFNKAYFDMKKVKSWLLDNYEEYFEHVKMNFMFHEGIKMSLNDMNDDDIIRLSDYDLKSFTLGSRKICKELLRNFSLLKTAEDELKDRGYLVKNKFIS